MRAQTPNNYRPTLSSSLPTALVVLLCIAAAAYADGCEPVTMSGTLSTGTCATVTASTAGQTINVQVTAETITSVTVVGPGDVTLIFANTGDVTTSTGDLVTTSGTAVGKLLVTFAGSWKLTSGHALNIDTLPPTSLLGVYVNQGKSLIVNSAANTSIVNAPSMSIPQLIVEGNGHISATGTAFSIGTVTGNAGITMAAKLECNNTVFSIPGGMTGSASISFGSQLAATLGGSLLSTSGIASSVIVASGVISTTGTHIVSISGTLAGQATFNVITMYGGSVAQFAVGTWAPTALQFSSITTTPTSGGPSVALNAFSTTGSNFVISTLSATNPIVVDGVSMVAGSVSSAIGMNNFNIGALGSTTISFYGASLSSTTALTSASSCFKIGTASNAQLIFSSSSNIDRCTVKGMAVISFVSSSASVTIAGYHTSNQGATTFSSQGSLFLVNADSVTIAARFPGTVNIGNSYGLMHILTGSGQKLSIMASSTITSSSNAFLITTTANSVAGLSVTMTDTFWSGQGLFAPTLVSLTGANVVITGASSVAGTNIGSRMSFLGTSLSLTAFTTSNLKLNSTILFAKTTTVTGMSIGAVSGSTLSMTSMTMTASTTIGIGLSVGAGVSFVGYISGVTMDVTQTGSAYNTNFVFGIMSAFQFTMTSVTLAATNYNVRFSSMAASGALTIASSSLTTTGSTATANLDLSSGMPTGGAMIISSVSFSSIGRTIAVGGVNTEVGQLQIGDCNATITPSSSVGAEATSFLSLGSLSQSLISVVATNIALTVSTSSAMQTINGVFFANNMDIQGSQISVTGITFSGRGNFNSTGQAVVIGGTGTNGVSSSSLYISNVIYNNISSESLIYQPPGAAWTSATMTVKCAEMRKVNYLVGSLTEAPGPAARSFAAQAVTGKMQNPVYFSGNMSGTNVLMIDSILAANVSTGSRGFVVSTTLTGTLSITYINNYFHVTALVADSPDKISVQYGCSYMASLVLSDTHFQFSPSLSSLSGAATCTKPGAGCYDTPSRSLTITETHTNSASESSSVTPTVSDTVTATSSDSLTKSPTFTATRTVSLSVSPTASHTLSASLTLSLSVTSSLTATPSLSVTLTPTLSVTPTQSVSMTPTASVTPTTSLTPSVSVTPSISHTPSLTETPTLSTSTTPTLTQTPTVSITPTSSLTLSPTVSLTPTVSVTPTLSTTLTPTATITPTMTVSPTFTATPTESATVSATETRTLTNSRSLSPSSTPTATGSGSASVTSSATLTKSPSHTASSTRNVSATSTNNVTDTASLTPSLTSITRKPTATNTFQVNLTDPLMSTRIRVVFNGTKWNVIVVNFPNQLELLLRQSIAARLGMPLANVNIIDYSVGSLIVIFEVTRNRTFAISDSGLLVELSYNVAYAQALSLYFNETGETAQLAEPIVVNPTSLSDEQPQSVTIGVIAGVVGLVLVLGCAVAVWWKFCRNADATKSTNEPHAEPQADAAAEPAEEMQPTAAAQA